MRFLAFFAILSYFPSITTANILNGTVTELLWPQMRSSVANYLVKNNILSGPDAYSQVFAKIPDSGNCWCNANKHETSKGIPQDLYDVACKKYHNCISCGYNSDIADFDENVVVSFYQKEASSSFNVSGGLVGIVESNNVLNFNADSNSIEIYEWECEENQSVAGMAVCKGFKQLENDFINIFLSEIELTGSYNQECSSGVGGDCSDCPVTQAAVTDVAEFEDLLNWVPPDSCCGVSPTWRSYHSSNGEKACCGTEIYDTTLYDCCNIETSELQLSGECNIPCSSNPCRNDGECTNSLDFESYICNCASEFTGTDCETKINTTQYLMYTLEDSGTIYSYTLYDDRDPVKNGQFTIPDSQRLMYPSLVFNARLNSLEIIGDFWDRSNKNHRMMTIAGSFSDVSGSLFDGDDSFEVCYSQNVGTLVFSGVGRKGATQVYIITQNPNWNQIESSDKYLSSFQNPRSGDEGETNDFYSFGVVEQDEKIYLIGGYSDAYENDIRSYKRHNQIQLLNLQNSASLQEAQTRQWTFITSLKNAVDSSAVIYSNGQLLVVGHTHDGDYQSPYTRRDVQYLSLASNTTGVYAGIVDGGESSSGLGYPGMYMAGGKVSIFGGYFNKMDESCVQQTAPETDVDSEWDCLSSTESALEGFGNNYDHVRYSNFVV